MTPTKGLAELALGRPDDATAHLDQALGVAGQIGELSIAIQAHAGLGDVLHFSHLLPSTRSAPTPPVGRRHETASLPGAPTLRQARPPHHGS